MCSGAIFWSGIGRLVYGLSKKRLNELVKDQLAHPQLLIGCREIFCDGPTRDSSRRTRPRSGGGVDSSFGYLNNNQKAFYSPQKQKLSRKGTEPQRGRKEKL